jgi:hypothetical protein
MLGDRFFARAKIRGSCMKPNHLVVTIKPIMDIRTPCQQNIDKYILVIPA